MVILREYRNIRTSEPEFKPTSTSSICFIQTFLISDYPDYSQNDYSQYAGQVKYESGEEQKYRPSTEDNGYNYRQDY